MIIIEWLVRSEVEDLIQFLRVTLMCLTYQPSTVREAVHFATCSHLHSSLMDALTSSTRVNVLGLMGLQSDVNALKEFADECGIPDLRVCFASVDELLAAILGEHWENRCD